jgi:hypothetical protein
MGRSKEIPMKKAIGSRTERRLETQKKTARRLRMGFGTAIPTQMVI